MGQILSPDEVNALLQGISDGTVPTEGGSGGARGVRPLDLTNQERSLRGHLPGLDLIFDRFLRTLRASLATVLGDVDGLTLVGVELLRYGNWVRRLTPPLSLHVFRLAPLHGNGLAVVSPELAAAVLEAFFGGSARRPTRVAAREYSAIETRVLQRFVAAVLRDFQDAWRPMQALDLAVLRSESNPAQASVAAAGDLTAVAELRLALAGAGDEAAGGEPLTLALCIPYESLDPVRAKLAAALDGPARMHGPSWGARLRERLDDVELEVSAELGGCELSMRRVIGLKVGEVLALDTSRNDAVVVRVEGLPAFHGTPGLARGAHAIRVLGRLGG